MNYEAIAVLAIFALGLPYIVLGFAAYGHFSADGSKKMLAAGPWWAFYDEYYDDTGKKLCRYGKIIMVAAFPVFLGSYFVS